MSQQLEELQKLWNASLEADLHMDDQARLNELMADADLMEEFSQAQAFAAEGEPESSMSAQVSAALDKKVMRGFRAFNKPVWARPMVWATAAVLLLGTAAVMQFGGEAREPYYEENKAELREVEAKKKPHAEVAEKAQPREGRERELRANFVSLPLIQPKTGPASIRVFDSAGRQVREIVDEVLEKGRHTFRWDGRTAEGAKVPGGSYKIEIRTTGGLKIRRVELRSKP